MVLLEDGYLLVAGKIKQEHDNESWAHSKFDEPVKLISAGRM
jgi:hypothetical protein